MQAGSHALAVMADYPCPNLELLSQTKPTRKTLKLVNYSQPPRKLLVNYSQPPRRASRRREGHQEIHRDLSHPEKSGNMSSSAETVAKLAWIVKPIRQ
jgi:hypothetical protein